MSVHKFIPFTCLFISSSVHLPTQQPSNPAIRPDGINGERHLKTASRKNEQIYSCSGQFWVNTDFYSHCDTPEQLPKAYLHPEKMPKLSQRTLLQPLQSFSPNHLDRVRTAKHCQSYCSTSLESSILVSQLDTITTSITTSKVCPKFILWTVCVQSMNTYFGLLSCDITSLK